MRNVSTKIISALVHAVLSMLDPEMLRGFIDAGLDFIEDYVGKTENEVDDSIVLPACALLRKAINCPDNDAE